MNKYLRLALLLLLISCNSNKGKVLHPEGDLVSLQVEEDNNPEIYVESLFDSVQFIPVQNSQLIGAIDLLAVKDDSLFLAGDTKFTQSLFLINSKGQIVNSYKYAGRGPQQGLYLQDIKYDSFGDNFIALLQNPGKLIFFDDSLRVRNVLTFSNDFFRFIPAASRFYLYAHNDQKIFQLRRGSEKAEEFFDLDSMDYYPFNPTPVFQPGFYFNVPYSPVVYKIEQGALNPIVELEYIPISTEQETETLLKKYPPVIQNIYESGEYLIIFFTYMYLTRAIIYPGVQGAAVSQGIFMDKHGITGSLFSQKDNCIYGTITSDRFVSFYNSYKNYAFTGDFPRIIFKGNVQGVKTESNPMLVKYYLKDSLN